MSQWSETAKGAADITNAPRSPHKAATESIGSQMGLTLQSKEATAWAHKAPRWLRPGLYSLLSFLQILFGASSLTYLEASIYSILVSGLSVIFTIAASKCIRKRAMTRERLIGAAIVLVGTIVIGAGGFVDPSRTTNSATQRLIGIAFLIASVLTGVLRNIISEIFIQETRSDPILLLGMSGVYSLVFGVPLYIAIGPSVGLCPLKALEEIVYSPFLTWYAVLFILIGSIGNLLTILLTGLTSSMTVAIWKPFRGLLVWGAALLVYYLGSDSVRKFGEPWLVPQSWIVLVGYAVLFAGVYLYYRQAPAERRQK